MRENNSLRNLRIERLEQRSLLAAGFIDLPNDTFDAISKLDRDRVDFNPRLTREVRYLSGDRAPNRDRGPRPRDQRVDPLPPNNVRPVEPFAAPVLVFDAIPNRVLPVVTSNDQPNRIVDVDVAFAPLVAVDSTSDVDVDDTVAVARRQETASLQTAEPSPIAADETTFDDDFVRRETIRIPDAATNAYDTVEGQVDLAPLWSTDNVQFEEDASPWQLGQSIVPSIRSIIDRAGPPTDEVVDALVQSWFGGSSGMISLDHVTLPISMVSSPIAWIDVQLESTVMLHRSLEMIAGGNTAPLSDVTLDAIMASLDAMAESQSQPVAGVKPVEVSAIVYPAIAVLTAVAVASRRKHKHPYHPDAENQ